MLTIVNIAQFMGGWQLDYVEGLSFYEVITLSLMQAEITDYQSRLSELHRERTKANHGSNRKDHRG